MSERFLSNPAPKYPEIRFMVHKEDLQFVVSYLRHKYGRQHVAETIRYIGPSWNEAAEIVGKFNLSLDRQYDLFKKYPSWEKADVGICAVVIVRFRQ